MIIPESNINPPVAAGNKSMMTTKEEVTTLMIRNIPNQCTHEMVLREFELEGHRKGDSLDFFYMPWDVRS